MNYRMRAFEPEDMQAIKDIDRLSFSAEEQYPDEFYNSLLAAESLRAIVAEDGRTAAGYALLDVKAQPVRIRSIAVAPAHRNKGCGAALLRYLIEQYDTLELLVEKSNAGAIRLYERLGFTFVERSSDAELAATHHMFRRFKKASCLNDPPPPNRAATSLADGTT